MDIRATLLKYAAKRSVQVGSSFGVGLGVGGSLTYFITRKRLEMKYNEIAVQEISDAKKYYSTVIKEKTPGEMVEDLGLVVEVEEEVLEELPEEVQTTLTNYQGVVKEEPEEDISPRVHNVFGSVVDTFDYDEEIKSRSTVDPYVISKEEFFQNENGNEQTTLTFFAGDNALADDKDELVHDIENTVGELNLERFGHGSGDPNVVYIHNPRIGLDMEVLQSQGKFAEEVLGFLEHSDKPGLRKFRSYDD